MLEILEGQLAELRLEPFRNALAVVLAGLALGWRPWRRERTDGADEARGRLANVLVVGGAYLAAFAGMNDGSLPAFPPTSSKHRVALLVFAAAPLGLVRGRTVRAWLARLVPYSALIAVFLWTALAPKRARWEGAEAALWLGGLALFALLHFSLTVDLLEGERSSKEVLVLVLVALGGLAQVLGQTTGESAHLVGALALVPAGWLALALLRRPRAPALGGAMGLSAATFGLGVLGVAFAGTPPLAVALVLLAPQVARVPGRGGWAWLGRVLVAMALSALAVKLAWVEPYPEY